MAGPENGNDVKLAAPGGWGLSVRGREGRETLVTLVLAVSLALLIVLVLRSLDRIEAGQLEQRTGRDAAVTEIARDHRALLCILALPQEARGHAVRSGDVCGYLLGGLRREDR
jgi:hypothetical protein